MHIRWKEPEGRYEDRYGQYLSLFKVIAQTSAEINITVERAPWSWVPLLMYLQCHIIAPTRRFDHCSYIKSMLWLGQTAREEIILRDFDRTLLEVFCCIRPETVDALWKIDRQWSIPHGRTLRYPPQDDFIVTTNGSYHREEVLHYFPALSAYVPKKDKVLIVPCAADKPYPAPLHKACLERMPEDFYLMNATGVLGLVPQDLWPIMPHYDSGIPNQWRLYEIARDYFRQHTHKRIVVYCDFYAHVLSEALFAVGGRTWEDAQLVLGKRKYDDYVDLLSAENLAKLEHALREPE